jgi:rare lipoprotein A
MERYKFYIHRNLAVVCLFVFCLTQLSGCSFTGNSTKSSKCFDGPPSVDIVDVSKISNAVPKSEPYHPYGTRNYVVGGRRYQVLKHSKGYVKRGNASWYGSKFHGKHTSTQERFNLYGMTAASRELPLPSYAKVTNLRNGKSVVVRVNDRGPFHSDRILDLSYAAAKKLDFVDRGTAPVKVVAIDPKTWEGTRAKTKYVPTKANAVKQLSSIPNKNESIYLQVGAFSRIDNAKELSTKIAKLTDNPIQINHSDNLYRVQVGPMACATQSNTLKQTLEANGFNKVVVVTS